MSEATDADGTSVRLDEEDRLILRQLQLDASLPLERLGRRIGLSKTAVWNRIQRLRQAGVILRNAVIIDPAKVGLTETFFVAIRTNQHNSEWLDRFQAVTADMPEVMEVHRMAGQIDYLLKVQVENTRTFDDFYKRLVSRIDLSDVTSNLSMEVMKQKTDLPI